MVPRTASREIRRCRRAPSGRRSGEMCFGALSFCEPCEVCGRCHPGGPAEQCLDRRAETEVASLDAELEGYLASPEARFFSWLAARA